MDDLSNALQKNIPLFEMIETLRRELNASINASKNEGLRFKLETIELELRVAVSRAVEGQGGIKFWVVSADGKRTAESEDVHVFRLKLQPVMAEDRGTEILVAKSTSALP